MIVVCHSFVLFGVSAMIIGDRRNYCYCVHVMCQRSCCPSSKATVGALTELIAFDAREVIASIFHDMLSNPLVSALAFSANSASVIFLPNLQGIVSALLCERSL